MRKIILICALCVAAFGFFKSCSEYETYEEREKCRKETGKMIGEGAVALSEIMSKAPGDYWGLFVGDETKISCFSTARRR